MVSEVPELVAHAAKAPSSHNTQPWRFRVEGDALALRADRRRALPVNDPRDRELTISCGAALFNLRVAAAHLGYGCEIELLPERSDPDLLARARFVEAGPHDSAAGALFRALGERRTHRKAFDDWGIPPETAEAIAKAATVEGVWVAIARGSDAREQLAALVAQGDRAQFADSRWRRELASWMRPRRQGDGLATARLAAPVTGLVVRVLDVGRGQAKRDAELARRAPLVAVLGTDGDAPADWLSAGQALERLLLTAATAGVQAGFLNQPCQVEGLRPRLADLVGRPGFPQLCLRLGFPGKATVPASRRPVEDILDLPLSSAADPAPGSAASRS